MRRFLVLVLLLVLAGCAAGDSSARRTPAVEPTVVVPDGWRWESYRGVEVAVPNDWGTTNGSQRLSQWCIESDRSPAVGRPGATTLVGCGLEKDPATASPDPATLVAITGPIVAFDEATFADGSVAPVSSGGDRTIVRVDDVLVIVQAEQPLRDQIARTIRRFEVDANECPASDPVSADPSRRPVAGVDVASLRSVTSVSACKYAVIGRDATLLSSLRIEDEDASRLVGQVAASPVGSGPNAPQVCSEEYGDEVIVLRIASASGMSAVHVRYSGCDHHGFDDGAQVRRLTAAALRTITSGGNEVGVRDAMVDRLLAGQ